MSSQGSNYIPDTDRLIVSINNILVESSRVPPTVHHKYAKTNYSSVIDPSQRITYFHIRLVIFKKNIQLSV